MRIDKHTGKHVPGPLHSSYEESKEDEESAKKKKGGMIPHGLLQYYLVLHTKLGFSIATHAIEAKRENSVVNTEVKYDCPTSRLLGIFRTFVCK